MATLIYFNQDQYLVLVLQEGRLSMFYLEAFDLHHANDLEAGHGVSHLRGLLLLCLASTPHATSSCITTPLYYTLVHFWLLMTLKQAFKSSTQHVMSLSITFHQRKSAMYWSFILLHWGLMGFWILLDTKCVPTSWFNTHNCYEDIKRVVRSVSHNCRSNDYRPAIVLSKLNLRSV